jgi:DNA-binding MarR family transcriptional regulator
MSPRLIDFRRVRKGLARLQALVDAYPELREPEAQARLMAWLAAEEEQRTRGTMAASYAELVRTLAHEKGNLSHSLANLEAKGLVRMNRTPGGKAEALDLTPQGQKLAAHLARSCE